MEIKKSWQPFFSSLLTSTPARVLSHIVGSVKHGRRLYFFHRVDDPWSHLLLLVMSQLRDRFEAPLEPRILLQLDETLNPHPQQRAELALRDAVLLARLYQLPFPETLRLPDSKDVLLATRILLAIQSDPKFCRKAMNIGMALWAGDLEKLERLAQTTTLLSEAEAATLLKNQQELEAKGHYNSAMIYFAGEWYWGLDRLDHLEDRLDPDSPPEYQRTWKPDTSHPGPCTFGSVDFYFSFRSPYSYVAAILLQDMSDLHGFVINYKPLLPMVKRGMEVPSSKRWYVLLDAKREADKHSIPFGKICDPLDGVENLLALVPFARQQNCLPQYMAMAMTAVWSQGLDVTRPTVLAEIAQRSGLRYDPAMLADQAWKTEVEKNRQDLDGLGLWGVPAFSVGKHAFWGQDRLWALERALTGNL